MQDVLQREWRGRTNSGWKEEAKFVSCRPTSFGCLTPYGIVYIDYVNPKKSKNQKGSKSKENNRNMVNMVKLAYLKAV